MFNLTLSTLDAQIIEFSWPISINFDFVRRPEAVL